MLPLKHERVNPIPVIQFVIANLTPPVSFSLRPLGELEYQRYELCWLRLVLIESSPRYIDQTTESHEALRSPPSLA